MTAELLLSAVQAGDDVGDPSATRTVYIAVALLVLCGVVLVAVAIWVFRRTRPDPALLAPLEEMQRRKWRSLDPAGQRRRLDEARPPGAAPLQRSASVPSVDQEFATARPVRSFSDLAGDRLRAERDEDDNTSDHPDDDDASTSADGDTVEEASDADETEPIAAVDDGLTVDVSPGDVDVADDAIGDAVAVDRSEVDENEDGTDADADEVDDVDDRDAGGDVDADAETAVDTGAEVMRHVESENTVETDVFDEGKKPNFGKDTTSNDVEVADVAQVAETEDVWVQAAPDSAGLDADDDVSASASSESSTDASVDEELPAPVGLPTHEDVPVVPGEGLLRRPRTAGD